MEVTSDILLDNLKKGDISAFETIYKLYYKTIFRFVNKFLKNTENAKEVTTDIFLAFWNQREKIVIKKNIGAYLIVTARNHCLNFLRTKNRLLSQNDLQLVELELYYFEDEKITDAISSNELEKHILIFVDQLPMQQKTVFQLSRSQGLSNEEIAQKLNLSKRTVETHLFMALKFLREKLKAETLMF
jgi:RNA polymerase sigma-70 factor, ECF subfamily